MFYSIPLLATYHQNELSILIGAYKSCSALTASEESLNLQGTLLSLSLLLIKHKCTQCITEAYDNFISVSTFHTQLIKLYLLTYFSANEQSFQKGHCTNGWVLNFVPLLPYHSSTDQHHKNWFGTCCTQIIRFMYFSFLAFILCSL